MPSIRKRIGYLPSPIIQDLITQIANNEKLSQSKVVGILVEEALLARGLFQPQKISRNSCDSLDLAENYIDNSSFKYNDLDEMISDHGISYNKKQNKMNKRQTKEISSKQKQVDNMELFEQFEQFLLFKKMLKEN
tara:strand:+ start:3978 stop:4382 length:405 start_codon:yes stop_codon:yes gene_type:complete